MLRRTTGFTLIELMVVVAVVAILGAIALPSYNDYVVRGKLVEAVTGLATHRIAVEQYWQDNRNYGTASAATCGAAGVPALPSSRYFTFSCAVGGTAQTYTATATSTAGTGLGSAGAYTFTINQQNVRRTTGFTGATVPQNCWLSKKGDTC